MYQHLPRGANWILRDGDLTPFRNHLIRLAPFGSSRYIYIYSFIEVGIRPIIQFPFRELPRKYATKETARFLVLILNTKEKLIFSCCDVSKYHKNLDQCIFFWSQFLDELGEFLRDSKANLPLDIQANTSRSLAFYIDVFCVQMNDTLLSRCLDV